MPVRVVFTTLHSEDSVENVRQNTSRQGPKHFDVQVANRFSLVSEYPVGRNGSIMMKSIRGAL